MTVDLSWTVKDFRKSPINFYILDTCVDPFHILNCFRWTVWDYYMHNDVLSCVEILVLSVFTWFISAWLENTIYLLLAILILLFFFVFFVCGKRTLRSICSKQNESVTQPHLLCLRFVLFRSNQMVTQTIKQCQEESEPIWNCLETRCKSIKKKKTIDEVKEKLSLQVRSRSTPINRESNPGFHLPLNHSTTTQICQRLFKIYYIIII